MYLFIHLIIIWQNFQIIEKNIFLNNYIEKNIHIIYNEFTEREVEIVISNQ